MITRYILGLIFIFTLSTSPALYAQVIDEFQVGSGIVRISDYKISQEGETLQIDLLFNFSKLTLHSCQSLVFYPSLSAQDTVLSLPSVLVNGKMDHIERERKKTFGLTTDIIEPNAKEVVLYNKRNTLSYRYQLSLPYQFSWMDDATITINGYLTNCKGSHEHLVHHRISEGISLQVDLPQSRYQVTPYVSFVRPHAEPVKDREDNGVVYLDFLSGKSDILPTYRNNKTELDKIRQTINAIQHDKDITLTSISVRGYASIDGNSASNMKLSLARANSLNSYLSDTYGFKSSNLTSSAEGEDWEELERLVQESDLASKESLLSIIRSTEALDQKEHKLRRLHNGVPYRELVKEFFPKLRRVQYTVNYSVRTFTLEEGQQLIKSRPGLLSLNEMFLVANSYAKGSEDFNRVFDIAVRLFPSDSTARLNASAIALSKGDLTSARHYLSGLIGAEADNNRGVLKLLEGDLTTAEILLEQAKAGGCADASHNLLELEKKRSDDEHYERILLRLKKMEQNKLKK